MSIFGKNVAVSLADDSFIFATQNEAPPLVLPAYVAIQTGTTSVLACGDEAKAMLGREPNNISVVKVLVEGVIADQQSAESLFRFGLRKLLGYVLIRPRVIIASRSYAPGMLAVKNMAAAGGAREVYLIDMGMATAIGMQLDVEKPEIKAVLSVSEDWFEFSIISLAGILARANGTIGSHAFVEDIQNHLTLARHFRPEFTALDSSLRTGGVNADAVIELPGWESWTGRSEHGRLTTQNVSRDEITVGMMPSLVRLTEKIKDAIRRLPNDKQYQLSQTTIHAAGKTMAIPGIAQLMANQLGHSVTPFTSEEHPSIDGCRTVLKELNFLKRVKTTKK